MGCVDGQEMAHGPGPESGAEGPWSVGQVSVGLRLIELEGTARSVVRNGLRIGGVKPVSLIELEDALGRRPSGRQWRGSGGEIQVGEDGANGNGIGDEGDDAHRSTTTTLRAVPRADERQDIIRWVPREPAPRDSGDDGCVGG